MTAISRAKFFGKLNPLGFKCIDAATAAAKLRGNATVELSHWLFQILQTDDSDLHQIIRYFEIDESRLVADLTDAIEGLRRGAPAVRGISEMIDKAVEQGWLYASVLYGSSHVRTGHLMIGMLRDQDMGNALSRLSKEFLKIKDGVLADDFDRITDGSPEEAMAPRDGSAVGGGAMPGESSGAMKPAKGQEEALAQFCEDLTAKARAGKIDPIVGRDEEIRQVVDVLMRRRQNNPILTGEAGVGKTAVVEGFALRIARGDVPEALAEARLLALDVGLLQAGASMKGEFEQRLRSVIDEVQASPKPVVMFIDETHTLVGAGGAAGPGDAANQLKPALARGELRTIGATTWAEYKKHIEKDPALTRRFQVVQVDEPDEKRAIMMMRGIASMLEKHHRVQVLDEAIAQAVKLSARYIPARQLPDKSVSVLDTACARVAISQHAVPAQVDDSRQRIAALATELGIIARDETAGYDVTERRAAVSAIKAEEEARLAELEGRWEAEKAVVAEIIELRAKLRAGGGAVEGPEAAKAPEPAAHAEAIAAPGAPTPLLDEG
ncbi:MAG: AAA family ATPase, partial [Pseudomonadota bacterium]